MHTRVSIYTYVVTKMWEFSRSGALVALAKLFAIEPILEARSHEQGSQGYPFHQT